MMRWLILVPLLLLAVACSSASREIKRAQDCAECGYTPIERAQKCIECGYIPINGER